MRKEITKINEDWKTFLTQHDQESRKVSLFFYDPDLLIKLLLPRAQESEPRRWNAAKYTREYEYSWKRF